MPSSPLSIFMNVTRISPLLLAIAYLLTKSRFLHGTTFPTSPGWALVLCVIPVILAGIVGPGLTLTTSALKQIPIKIKST